MSKNKLKTIAVAGTVCLTAALIATISYASGNLPFASTLVEATEYHLTLDSTNQPTDSVSWTNAEKEIMTGPNASFSKFIYTNVKYLDGGHCSIKEGGVIEKELAANSLTSLNFTLGGGSVKVQTGVSEGVYDTQYTVNASGSLNVCGNYIKLTALEDADLTSLTINYGCSSDSAGHSFGSLFDDGYGHKYKVCSHCGIAYDENAVQLESYVGNLLDMSVASHVVSKRSGTTVSLTTFANEVALPSVSVFDGKQTYLKVTKTSSDNYVNLGFLAQAFINDIHNNYDQFNSSDTVKLWVHSSLATKVSHLYVNRDVLQSPYNSFEPNVNVVADDWTEVTILVSTIKNAVTDWTNANRLYFRFAGGSLTSAANGTFYFYGLAYTKGGVLTTLNPICSSGMTQYGTANALADLISSGPAGTIYGSKNTLIKASTTNDEYPSILFDSNYAAANLANLKDSDYVSILMYSDFTDRIYNYYIGSGDYWYNVSGTAVPKIFTKGLWSEIRFTIGELRALNMNTAINSRITIRYLTNAQGIKYSNAYFYGMTITRTFVY